MLIEVAAIARGVDALARRELLVEIGVRALLGEAIAFVVGHNDQIIVELMAGGTLTHLVNYIGTRKYSDDSKRSSKKHS